MNKLYKRGAALGIALILAACGGSSDSDTPAPTNFTVQPADGAVIVSWTQQPGLVYWLFSAQSTTLTRDNVLSQTKPVITNGVSAPYAQINLTNGLPYSFLMNAANGGDKAGASTATITVTPQASGYTWTAGAPISNVDLYAQSFSGTTYVNVGASGNIYSSSDSVAWSARSSGVSANLRGVTYNASLGTRFVAAGDGGTVLTSTDGITWATQVSGVTGNLRSVASSTGLYVAVGDNGLVTHSVDGVNWAQTTAFTSANLLGITYDGINAKFFAVGQGGVMYSSGDAVTWTQITTGTTNDLYSVAFGNGLMVAVGAQGTILQSADGQGATWTTVASPTNNTLYSVTYGSQFEAAGAGGVTMMGSTTGTSWTASTSGTTSDLFALSFFNYRLLAVGAAGANTLSF